MFKVSPASLQTFIDTPNCVLEDRVQYSTVHIPNVFCDCHLQLVSCVLYCNRQVHRDFLITLYIHSCVGTDTSMPYVCYYIGCPNKSARFNFLIKRIIYSKSVDIFISV